MYESGFGRVIGVLISPVKTFRSIAEHPTWGAALVVLVLVVATVGYIAADRTDFEDVVRGQIADSGREVPEEALEQQIALMEKSGGVLSLLSVLGVPLMALLLAAIFLGAFRMVGSELDFSSSFSVVIHSLMPMIVSSLLSLPVILSKQTFGYEDLKDGGYLISNLAFLAPDEAPAVVRSLLGSIDLFTLWTLALLVIGYRAVAKVSQKTATVAVIVLWLIYVAIKAGWAAAFG